MQNWASTDINGNSACDLFTKSSKTSKTFFQAPREAQCLIFSGSWVFGSSPSTMKFFSVYTVDHCTCITGIKPQMGLLSLAVLFFGVLSVYSLCCKKEGNNWIAIRPVGQENVERRNRFIQCTSPPIEGQAPNNGTE